MSEKPASSGRERLAKALDESRRIEKELNARDLEAEAEFDDRLAQRLEHPGEVDEPN